MKEKRIISIILIICLFLSALYCNSFAIEGEDVVGDNTIVDFEENTDNQGSNQENITENENNNENLDSGNDNNNEVSNDNSIQSGNNEFNENNNETGNNNIEAGNNGSNDNNNETGNNNGNNVEQDSNIPNNNSNETNNNEFNGSIEEVTDENQQIEQNPEQVPEQVPEQSPEQDGDRIESGLTNNTVIIAKSENANLRILNLDVEGITPEFDKNITEYYLIVDLSVEEINIEAYPEDGKAIVLSIEGNTELIEGQNTIKIVVKAEAGNTKTYVINVTKTDDIELVNASLKNLLIEGFNFYPSFKSNIYNYALTINERVSQLEIVAETENEEATYEIVGNEQLREGDNLIKVIVTAQDGETKREYKINVFMDSNKVEVQEINRMPAIILLSVIGIAIIGISVAISKKH